VKPFSIIANNCWSNKIYEGMRIPYQTPLISIFMHPDCYLKMIGNLFWYLHQPLEFIEKSRHPIVEAQRQSDYPVALLGGDVELQCLHYTSRDEVREKWARRLPRIVASRFIFKFCDSLGCTPEQLEAFDAKPFPSKICYTSKPMPHLKSAVYIPGGESVSFEAQTRPEAFRWVESQLEGVK